MISVGVHFCEMNYWKSESCLPLYPYAACLGKKKGQVRVLLIMQSKLKIKPKEPRR